MVARGESQRLGNWHRLGEAASEVCPEMFLQNPNRYGILRRDYNCTGRLIVGDKGVVSERTKMCVVQCVWCIIEVAVVSRLGRQYGLGDGCGVPWTPV